MPAPSLDPTALAALGVAAFGTAALSATVGIAGGMVLLAVMLLFLDPLTAIPLHGAVQLVSNATRAWVQREHVRTDLVGRYAVLLFPMGVVGLQVATRVPADWLARAIGLFIVLATWAPAALVLGGRPDAIDPRRRFLLLGGLVGLLGPAVGATGPIAAPFFLHLGLDRFAIIGTQAACQTLGHFAKLAVFGAAGFAFAPWLGLLGGLAAMVVAGTWTGSRLLARVDERLFTAAYKTLLTGLAIRLLVVGSG